MFKFILASLLLHSLALMPLLLHSSFSVEDLNTQTGNPIEVQFVTESKKNITSKRLPIKKLYQASSLINKVLGKLEKTNMQKGIKQERLLVGSLKPIYPISSRKLKEEGVTKLKITIDASGNIIDHVLIRSSGHRRLDQAAIKAIQQVKYHPLNIENNKVTSSQELVFDFQLKKL